MRTRNHSCNRSMVALSWRRVCSICAAGCDVLLMPSRFEPCGLNQLFAMRYGTIPVAHATGGLRDTIADYNPHASGAQKLPNVFGPGLAQSCFNLHSFFLGLFLPVTATCRALATLLLPCSLNLENLVVGAHDGTYDGKMQPCGCQVK